MAGGADHLLLDTVRRRLRQPVGWVAVVLHLSRLAPPAPRAHHRRIARVLMDDTARRLEGMVFALANGDLLLLCRTGDERRPPAGPLRVASPQALPDVLGRLLRADVADPRDLVSLWPLEALGDQLLAYALDRVANATGTRAVTIERQSQPGTVDAIAAALAAPDVADLLQRRTAVLIAEDGMRPLFREIRFSMAALESRVALAARTDSDPFLFRHLAERLDRRLLGLVGAALGSNEALDLTAPMAPRLHLNLTLGSLRSEAFARLAEALLGRGMSLGIEVSLVDACADPDRFQQAHSALRRLDMTLVLDGVSHQTLQLADVAALQPDLVKLAWSPQMAEPGAGRESGEQRLIRELGADRVVLHHAATEAALRWGLERGIRRFQGRQVDAMLAALRLSACEFASGCTLQQCGDRAAAAAAPGRQGCRNRPLLDAATPAAAAAAPPIAARRISAADRPTAESDMVPEPGLLAQAASGAGRVIAAHVGR